MVRAFYSKERNTQPHVTPHVLTTLQSQCRFVCHYFLTWSFAVTCFMRIQRLTTLRVGHVLQGTKRSCRTSLAKRKVKNDRASSTRTARASASAGAAAAAGVTRSDSISSSHCTGTSCEVAGPTQAAAAAAQTDFWCPPAAGCCSDPSEVAGNAAPTGVPRTAAADGAAVHAAAAANDEWTAADEEELMHMIEQELLAAAAVAASEQQQQQRAMLLPPLQGYNSAGRGLAAEGALFEAAAGPHAVGAAAAAGGIRYPMPMLQGAAAQGQNNDNNTAVRVEELTARYAAIYEELQLLEELHASLQQQQQQQRVGGQQMSNGSAVTPYHGF
jgi:hypothetical protein